MTKWITDQEMGSESWLVVKINYPIQNMCKLRILDVRNMAKIGVRTQ